MNNLFSYDIPVIDYFSLDLPKGAQILTVQVHNGEPKLWALVDNDKPNEKRKFLTVYTGDSSIRESPEMLNYIGTFHFANGGFICHVFEIKKIK